MKKNIGKADRFNRAVMIPLLALGAYFTSGWVSYLLIAITVYEVYTVLFGNCLVYQMLGLSSKEREGTPA